VRIGSPAITTRGFTEIECEQLAHLVADVLDSPGESKTNERVKRAVAALTVKFPVYR
jgi:glycine hydroxymethyltransferase